MITGTARLILTVTEFHGPESWDWTLRTASGELLGRHRATLDLKSWEYAAFRDLFTHIRWRTTAASRARAEPAVGRKLGTWATAHLLGELAGFFTEPATVEVILPRAATAIALLPLEAMVLGDRTLACQRVTFVFHICDDGIIHPDGPAKRPAGDRMRILAVFSLPSGTSALALRRERVALAALIEQTRYDIDLRVLQYGITREVLQHACAEPAGWDVLHVSGHGAAGTIVLEDAVDEPDYVSSRDLVEILAPLARSVSLVTLSSCQSAAAAGDAGLARDVARRLDCSVVAMRFPVADEFAAEFVTGIYDEMINARVTLPAAIGLTLEKMTGAHAGSRAGQLLFSTPAVFGCRAASLRIGPTARRRRSFPVSAVPSPERFVGRVGLLARAGRALAEDSGLRGVVFQGMAGAGKTACAQELVQVRAGGFDRVVWYSYSAGESDPGSALVRFAETLDVGHPGLGLRERLADPAAFERAVSDLAIWCEEERILTVLDDAESLVDDRGWRTAEWRAVITALTPQGGHSRIVITSSKPITGAYEACTVPLLSQEESQLLARELPQLGELLKERSSELKHLVGRVLQVAQGHPGLLELANRQADDPLALDTFLNKLESDSTDNYQQALVDWAGQALLSFPDEAQKFFTFVCFLEEADRRDLLAGTGPLDWTRVWRICGGSRSFVEFLPSLLKHGLVNQARAARAVHPAIEAHYRLLNAEFLANATEVICGHWGYLFATALYDGTDQELTETAAWRGIPYAARLRDGFRLAAFTDAILSSDHSRATCLLLEPVVAAVAACEDQPGLRRAASYLLARIGRDLNPDSAAAMKAVVAEEIRAGNWDTASSMQAELFEHFFRLGDLDAAMDVADAMVSLAERDTRRGRIGTIAARRLRLDVLNRRGRHHEVIPAAQNLLQELKELDETDDGTVAGPSTYRSMQRERVLASMSSAAIEMRNWESALGFNLAILEELRRRNAPEEEQAVAIVNLYLPLLNLNRLDDASKALTAARQEFERLGDLAMLGRVLGAQGEVEAARGNHDLAVDLFGEALRHCYLQPDLITVADLHSLYGASARKVAQHPAAIAHLAAAAALDSHAGDAKAVSRLTQLSDALAALDDSPGDEAATAILDGTAGPGFRKFARQLGLPANCLGGACNQAQRMSAAHPAHLLALWDPIFSALVCASRGNQEARQVLEQALAEQETQPDWTNLVAELRLLLDRKSGGQGSLDTYDQVLLNRARAALHGDFAVRPNLWRACGLRGALCCIVLAVLGVREGRRRALELLAARQPADDRLTLRLGALLEGERDPQSLVLDLDPIGTEVIETVLDYIG